MSDLTPITTWGNIEDKPTTFLPSGHRHNETDIAGLPEIKTILLTLSFLKSTELYRGYNVGTQWIDASVSVTTQIQPGNSVYGAMRDYAAWVNGAGTLEIYGFAASGQNFVSGNMINVYVTLIK